MLKRRIVTFVVTAGIIAGLAPIGAAPAQAGKCDSDIAMWFWYGAIVEVSMVGKQVPNLHPAQPGVNRAGAAGPPVNIDSTYYSCTLAPTAGINMNNPVLPGATIATAVDRGAPCKDLEGYIVGLGAGPKVIGAGDYGDGIGLNWAGGQGDFRKWLYPRDAVTGGCDETASLQNGPASGRVPIDPTQLGEIRAWTTRIDQNAGARYSTIDR